MKHITNFIEESYSYNPMVDRDQLKSRIVDKFYKDIAKILKSKTMTKEDIIVMLNDLIATVEAEF